MTRSLSLILAISTLTMVLTPFKSSADIKVFEDPLIDSTFDDVDTVKAWEAQTHVFHCNETQFNPKNIVFDSEEGTVGLKINSEAYKDRSFSGSELKYVGQKDSALTSEKADFLYGRFTANMKTAKFPGTVSSLFLYRSNPWQEIDIEFLGANPKKIQFNVYYNQGADGEANNDWTKHSAEQFDLPFDSSEDFHEYTIDWGPTYLRWYVDGELYREITDEAQIPYLPMTLRMNHWGVCDGASGWAGAKLAKDRLMNNETTTVQYRSIKVWQGNGDPSYQEF